MEEWKEYRLGDICDTISDTYKGNSLQVVLINTSDVLEGKCLNHTPVPNKNLKGQFKKTFCNEDILYSEIRPANKRFAYIDFEPKDYIASTKLMVIRSKEEVLPKYLYYILQSNQMLDKLQTLAETRSGTFPQITFSELAAQKIILPGLNSQKKIVQVLESINSKIELNRRINENLELQAQALFKSWFVDFEPFKDSKFVDSELGRIPEGWKVKKLEELCDSISVTHPYKKGQLIFLNTGDIENGFVLNHKYMNIKDMPGQAKKSIQENDILYSEIRPINRHFAFVNFPAQEYIVSTKLMVIRAVDKKSAIRLYQYLTSDDVINELQHEAESRSGTFPQIRFENIKKIKILIGPNDIENQYIEFIGNIYKMIFQYRKEIIKLEGLRDTLLPKLMSGELKINDFNN